MCNPLTPPAGRRKGKGNDMARPRIVFLDAGSVRRDIPWPDFASLGEIVIHEYTAKEDIPVRIKDAEAVLTNKTYLTAEHIAAAPKLRYIGTLATGYNQVDGKAAAARGIPVCNVPDYSTPSVVQHVFTLIFALSSDVCALSQSVRNGEWSKSTHFCYWNKPIMEMREKTIGIIGYGDIGSAVARAAHAFGMRVLAYAPRRKSAPDYSPFAFTGLEELFAQADVVSLHCPLTPENTGMVNAALLGRMKKTALLINCARGPLVNEQDLLQALEQGEIAGAGLDVVAHEPMRDDNPLRFAPNCLITPHVAWSSVESRTRLMKGVFDNLNSFLEGRPINVKNGV